MATIDELITNWLRKKRYSFMFTAGAVPRWSFVTAEITMELYVSYEDTSFSLFISPTPEAVDKHKITLNLTLDSYNEKELDSYLVKSLKLFGIL